MDQLTLKVTISDITTYVTDVRTVHDVDQPIATGTIVIPGPRPSHVEPSAVIKVEAGWGNDIHTIFSGTLGDDSTSFDESGGVTRVAIEGWGKLLWYANLEDQAISGPIELHYIVSQLCIDRGVPYKLIDYAKHHNDDDIILGGNSKIDDGDIIVASNSSPGDVIDRLGRLFGYRTFDRPDGILRFKRISGLPNIASVQTYTEGVDFYDVQQSRTVKGMVNYWEIFGANYTASDGSTVAIRSIPASVTPDPLLGPLGINRKSIRDSALINETLADSTRNTMEIDYSTPQYRWSWTVNGDSERAPGQVVTVVSPTVGGEQELWLMHVSQSISMSNGWTTTMEGWSGNGEPLPAGSDCVTQALLDNQGLHIGNQYLSNYRNRNPYGISASIDFTVLDDYSSLTISGYAHSTNSFNGNVSSTASRFEIWQGGESVAEGELPRQNENTGTPYTVDANWQAITIPLSGSLEAGPAQLRIISGYDSNVSDYDDFEVRDLSIRTCGVGSPI